MNFEDHIIDQQNANLRSHDEGEEEKYIEKPDAKQPEEEYALEKRERAIEADIIQPKSRRINIELKIKRRNKQAKP